MPDCRHNSLWLPSKEIRAQPTTAHIPYSDTRGILSMPGPSLSQQQSCDLSGRVDTQVQLQIHVYSTCDTDGSDVYKNGPSWVAFH